MEHIFGKFSRTFVLLVLSVLSVLSLGMSSQSIATVSASPLVKPTGKVILKIHGNLTHKNADDGAHFDYAMLEQLGLVEMSIDTPWTPVGTRFEGILSKTLLELIGAEGAEVLAEAVDGYSKKIPLEDLTSYDTLLALRMDGKRMRLKNKGPLWIVYPNDGRPDVIESTLNSRMVWQLRSLTIR